MKVLVVTAVAGNGQDLQFVMIARVKGVTMVSPIMTREGKAANCWDNSCTAYDDAVAQFTGCSKHDCSINIFDHVCGNLEGWV